MTSANVSNFIIIDKGGIHVGYHRQNWMCKTRWEELLKYIPSVDYLIQEWGYDEDEELWEEEPQNLEIFLKRVKI